MYYTAVSTAGEAAGTYDQRVGVVESDDLFSFHRVLDAPACEVDSRWYRTVDYSDRVSETWRDPQVFRDADGERLAHADHRQATRTARCWTAA